MTPSTAPAHSDNITWWVWWDHLLEEWFYTDIDPDTTPGLLAQLLSENVVFHQVLAKSGFEAIEKIHPNHRAAGRQSSKNRPSLN